MEELNALVTLVPSMHPLSKRRKRVPTDLMALHLLDQLITLIVEDLGDPRAASRLLQLAHIPLNKLTGSPLPPYTSDPGLARAYLKLRRIVRQLSRGPYSLPEPTLPRHLGRPPGYSEGPNYAPRKRNGNKRCMGGAEGSRCRGRRIMSNKRYGN